MQPGKVRETRKCHQVNKVLVESESPIMDLKNSSAHISQLEVAACRTGDVPLTLDCT